jgi:hypothetical protein
MTELSGQRRVRGRGFKPLAGGSLGALACVALAAALSGCGASAALQSAALAPLSVLPDTDVVLETNLQVAMQGGLVNTGLSSVSTAGNNGGGYTTSGAPTSENVVSVANGTGVSLYSAFNPLDKHCLGTLVIQPGSLSVVLGESTPGTYDFWFGPTTSTACTASGFLTETKVPSGWAKNDPASGWPLP